MPLKVIKEKEQSLLLNYFGRQSQYYLVLSICTFFDFERPDEPLKESEMWPFLQDQLGQDAILDAGMPKMHGEVLLAAKCFVPGGKPVPACPVRMQMGDIRKELAVYGTRYWESMAGVDVITDPGPFKVMDLAWSRAFGGPEYKRNPGGLGMNEVRTADDRVVRPLPNVEQLDRLIGGPGDRPEPAGFMPLDMTWPQRASKMGTYDNKWFRERWPYYPEDMDWTFFNVAQEDQWLRDAYFTGGEGFTLENMHPDRPVISSKLPKLGHRCFLLQFDDWRAAEADRKETFREVGLHLDTVWLFPHALRGVTIHRGVAEVADDEAVDVERIFLTIEQAGQKRLSHEDYLEEMRKRLDRKVKPNMAPLEAAKKKIQAALDRVANIGQEIQDATDRALGKAPIEKKTPADHVALASDLIEKNTARLDQAKVRLEAVKARFGHYAKIDLAPIDQAKADLAKAGDRIKQAAAKIEEGQAKVQAFKSEFKDQLKQSLAGAKSDQIPDIDLDALFDRPPENPWHESGMIFATRARRAVKTDPEAMSFLRGQGLNPQTVKRAWLGINTESRTEDRAAWGLEVKDDPKFVIPAGLVLPRFEGATLTRLLIWEDYAASPYQVRAVEGSQEQALVLGAGEGKAFLRVGNEIEAWLLSQELRGLCAVAAMTDAGTPLDDDSAGMLAQAPQFLVVKDPGRLDDPDGELAKWQALHPEAEFLAPPPGSSLAQAKNNGTNLRRWVLNALKPGLAPAEEDEEAEDPNQIVPKIVIPDIPAIVKKTQDDIKAAMKPKLDKAKAHVAEEGAKLDDMVRKAGYDPDALKAQADPLPKGNPFGAARVTEAFAQAREQLKKTQSLTPEIEKYLAENEKKLVEVQTQAAKLYDEGMPKIEAAKNLSPISDEAKAQFAAMGVDLDEPRTLTREDVIERYKDGRSMAGKNMSGVDLSGLELPGIDMKKAKLEKTNLSGTNLEGADLSRAIANEADFSQACLKSAVMNRAIMQKAKMSKADLKGADLTGALLSGSDLSGARMPGATLEKTLLEGANLTGADMSGTKAVRGYFLKTDLTGANFAGADVSRAIFSEAILPEADFSGATARKTLFHKVTGGKNRFGLADMFNVRVIEGSTFPDSDFSGATMDKSFWRDADLSRSDFSAVSMERAIMERCQMNGTDFSRAQGKRAGFNKSDMSWADLSGINMPGGSLRKTRLPKADLSGANLYSVEFMKTGMNETKLDGANLKLTKIYKREDLLP